MLPNNFILMTAVKLWRHWNDACRLGSYKKFCQKNCVYRMWLHVCVCVLPPTELPLEAVSQVVKWGGLTLACDDTTLSPFFSIFTTSVMLDSSSWFREVLWTFAACVCKMVVSILILVLDFVKAHWTYICLHLLHSFHLLVLDLKVEVSTEPVVEEGLLNITGGL